VEPNPYSIYPDFVLVDKNQKRRQPHSSAPTNVAANIFQLQREWQAAYRKGGYAQGSLHRPPGGGLYPM
jgi:hypothetical protein